MICTEKSSVEIASRNKIDVTSFTKQVLAISCEKKDELEFMRKVNSKADERFIVATIGI